MSEPDADRFEREKAESIRRMPLDTELQQQSRSWFISSCRHRYSYNFKWLGLPIIQYPQDILAMQEIIWDVKPDLIVETGIARGGSLVFYASMLELIGDGRVLGIDIDIRSHNRKAIESHPMSRRISMMEGSSIDPDLLREVKQQVESAERVLVVLDSNHTHDHVLEELRLYSPFVRQGGYLVVFDTVIGDIPEVIAPDRPWNRDSNPATAVARFLETNDRFMIDNRISDKLLLTVAPRGFLKCVKD
jgi:cephalosporin hydroxylase